MKGVLPHTGGLGPLARRYASLTCGLTLALLFLAGGWEAYGQYGDTLDRIRAVQAVEAEGASREIAHYTRLVEAVLRDVAKLDWTRADHDVALRREEFYRVMALLPAVLELRAVDERGRETLHVSRNRPDRLGVVPLAAELAALLPVSGSAPLRRGPTFFREGRLPTQHLAVFDGQGAILATIDLRHLGDIVAALHAGEGGLAYLVDENATLIAHPEAPQMIRRLHLSGSPSHAAALAQAAAASVPVGVVSATSFDGWPVIFTAAAVRDTGWVVFVEQRRDAAIQPVWATLWRTAQLMLLGGIAALLLGVAFAQQMAAPIVGLRQATARIADGDLQTTLDTAGGHARDEIADLAQDFNRMVERLRESYASLEAKVADRTAELSLRKDEAERANAAKTRFLAAASHDLRQPMHSISLLMGVLRSRLQEPTHTELAEKVQASVATMESLFGNLLDISKLDAGAVKVHVEDVPLGWLMERLAHTWAPQAVEKGLQLRVRPSALAVRGDATLLERIAGNLVSNALRYTRSGGVLVGCRRRGEAVVLEVWDSGPGIAPEHRQAIFEEFYRIEAPGTGGEKGLGLGLSIVQRCAQLLGYGLEVQSRVGRGTVFRLRMPLAESSVPLVPLTSGLGDAGALAGNFVAVVDDDETNRLALRDALLGWQCHVVVAASLEDLLAQLADHLRVPDLLVTDYQLGARQQGFEVIAALRAEYDTMMPALVVTANTDAGLQAEAQALGARLLHKPVGLQRLLEAMLAVLPERSPS